MTDFNDIANNTITQSFVTNWQELFALFLAGTTMIRHLYSNVYFKINLTFIINILANNDSYKIYSNQTD